MTTTTITLSKNADGSYSLADVLRPMFEARDVAEAADAAKVGIVESVYLAVAGWFVQRGNYTPDQRAAEIVDAVAAVKGVDASDPAARAAFVASENYPKATVSEFSLLANDAASVPALAAAVNALRAAAAKNPPPFGRTLLNVLRDRRDNKIPVTLDTAAVQASIDLRSAPDVSKDAKKLGKAVLAFAETHGVELPACEAFIAALVRASQPKLTLVKSGPKTAAPAPAPTVEAPAPTPAPTPALPTVGVAPFDMSQLAALVTTAVDSAITARLSKKK